MNLEQPFHIIRLSAPDLGAMTSLLRVFGDAFDEGDTYGQAQPRPEYLQRLLTQDYFIALAAFSQGEVIGGLVAYELQKFEQERSEIYIYDLAVATEYRRQGVATALIETLKTIAATCGAYVIFVQADYGDEPAIQLYTKLGRRDDVIHFDIVP